MDMPTYERRFHLETFKSEIEQRNEQIEENRTTSSSGSRTTTVSGESLKSKMRSGEIK